MFDGRRVHELHRVVEILFGLNQVDKGSIDDNRVRWVVGWPGGDYFFARPNSCSRSSVIRIVVRLVVPIVN